MAGEKHSRFHERALNVLCIWLLFCFDLLAHPQLFKTCASDQQFQYYGLTSAYLDQTPTGPISTDNPVLGHQSMSQILLTKCQEDYSTLSFWVLKGVNSTSSHVDGKDYDGDPHHFTIRKLSADEQYLKLRPFSPVFMVESTINESEAPVVWKFVMRTVKFFVSRTEKPVNVELFFDDEEDYDIVSTFLIRFHSTKNTTKGNFQRRHYGEHSSSSRHKTKQERAKAQDQKQRKWKLSCMCQCRTSDTFRQGKADPTPRPIICRLHLRFILSMLWVPSKFCTCSRSFGTPDRKTQQGCDGQGKRYKKLQFSPWSVDTVPNRKGQALSNAVNVQNLKNDVSRHQRRNGSSHRSRVDLLMISEERQSADSEGSWSTFFVSMLVFIACMRVLRDQNQREARKHLPSPNCPPLRPRKEKRTTRNEQDLNENMKNGSNPKESATGTSAAKMSSYGEDPRVSAPATFEMKAGGISFSIKTWHCRSTESHSHCSQHPSTHAHKSPDRDVRENSRSSVDEYSRKNIQHKHHSTSGDDYLQEDIDIEAILRSDYSRENMYIVYPATAFLPTLCGADAGGKFLDHVGYRLASLAALPPTCNLSRVRLAETGFHYNPRADPTAVRCHRCGAAYRLAGEGSSEMNPMAYHQSVSPQCPLVSGNTAPAPPSMVPSSQVTADGSGLIAQPPMTEMSSSSGTTTAALALPTGGPQVLAASDGVRDLAEDCEASGPLPSGATNQRSQQNQHRSSGYTMALPGSSIDQLRRVTPLTTAGGTESRRDSVGEERPPMDLNSAVYPQFGTAACRLATYRNWPLADTFPPQDLASQGFYYAGYADCVRCFFCGVGLKSWIATDDILTEHVRWRPNCPFLLATKGRQQIQDIAHRINGGGNSANGQPQNQAAQRQAVPAAQQSNTGSSSPVNQNNSASANSASARDQLQSDGQDGQPNDLVFRQLLTMGFTVQDIARAQDLVVANCQTVTFDNLLNQLFDRLT